MQNKKVITFVVPCYNSADYMDNCIKSLVDLNSIDDDIEIIIVDDGSQEDNTLKKAQAWKKKFPAIVKVIHQENGGHGAAVNIGLKSAKGLYFNVVDSDDYLDKQGTAPVMEYIRKQARTATDISPATDMIIANYVYNKATKNKLVPMKYTKFLPQNREFTWDDIKKFKMTYYLSMHSIIYRTQILQDINFELPKHTFYVDSIYSCEPLMYVNSIYYINTNMYMYYIGRDDQSVNEDVIMNCEDQMIRVTKIMIDRVDVEKLKTIPKLENYIYHYIAMMMGVCTVILRKKNTKESKAKLKDLSKYLKNRDDHLYKSVHRFPLCGQTTMPTPVGRAIVLTGYKISKIMIPYT